MSKLRTGGCLIPAPSPAWTYRTILPLQKTTSPLVQELPRSLNLKLRKTPRPLRHLVATRSKVHDAPIDRPEHPGQTCNDCHPTLGSGRVKNSICPQLSSVFGSQSEVVIHTSQTLGSWTAVAKKSIDIFSPE